MQNPALHDCLLFRFRCYSCTFSLHAAEHACMLPTFLLLRAAHVSHPFVRPLQVTHPEECPGPAAPVRETRSAIAVARLPHPRPARPRNVRHPVRFHKALKQLFNILLCVLQAMCKNLHACVLQQLLPRSVLTRKFL